VKIEEPAAVLARGATGDVSRDTAVRRW